MKFIIRDDDVNFFYTPSFLEERYKGIFEIAPISICAVPFVKGDYFKWVYMAENDKEKFESQLDQFYDDDDIHCIGDNIALIKAFKKWHSEGKVGICMHGIHHRNWDRNAPQIPNNYISGAEMWTKEDRTEALKEAKKYMEELLGIPVNTFTAPQNMISIKSYESIKNAGFDLNADVWPTKDVCKCISLYGLKNYILLVFDKMCASRLIYPGSLNVGSMNVTTVTRIYPSHKLEDIKKNFDHAYKKNGIFVLGTHSYAYDFKMKHYDMTLKEGIIEIVNYSKQFSNVEYTTLGELNKQNY